MESKITREEQIKQAEIKYSNDTLLDGCDYIGQVAKQEAFTAGAKWADKHPKPEMVNKQEFIELVIGWVKNRDNVEKHLHMQTSLIDGFADALRKYLEE